MKRNQYISILFLAAVTLVLAHGIIPHHHFDESCLVKQCGDPHEPAEPGQKHARPPWHCQAYSHVVFIGHNPIIKFKIPDTKRLLPAFITEPVVISVFAIGLFVRRFSGETPTFNANTLSLLRAPPTRG